MSQTASDRDKGISLFNCIKLLMLWPYGVILLVLCMILLPSLEHAVWSIGISCLWFLMMSFALMHEIKRRRQALRRRGDNIRLYYATQESPVLAGGYTYSGARVPALANKSLFYPRNVLACLFALLLGGVCLGHLYLVDAHAPYTRVMTIEFAWGVTCICLLDWMLKMDLARVTLHYSFRKKAIVIRSSENWIAVIPYTELRAWHVGKKYGILETKSGAYIPCPATLPDAKLAALTRLPYRSGRIRICFIMIISYYLLSLIGVCIQVGANAGFTIL